MVNLLLWNGGVEESDKPSSSQQADTGMAAHPKLPLPVQAQALTPAHKGQPRSWQSLNTISGGKSSPLPLSCLVTTWCHHLTLCHNDSSFHSHSLCDRMAGMQAANE